MYGLAVMMLVSASTTSSNIDKIKYVFNSYRTILNRDTERKINTIIFINVFLLVKLLTKFSISFFFFATPTSSVGVVE